jgi:hypothetical protein
MHIRVTVHFLCFLFYMYLTCTLLFVLAEAYDLLDPSIKIAIKMGYYAVYSDAYFVSSTLRSNRCPICRTVLLPMFCLDACLLMKLQRTKFKCVA